MINYHGDWNHKKTMHIASDLAEDIQEAKQKYIEKRDHFIALSVTFKDRVPEWTKMSRTATKVGKDAASVYKHSATKVPSQKTIYTKMLTADDNFAPIMVPKSNIARFLDRGLRIQDTQYVLW
ncbi:hypothetical protein B0H19DRAFT_1272592 [Mycena capillaripes]|nr:hypothetical protein B0H19DRAFT_1272417 [Mycena capillaripes]KAJ6533200.1 hypothetical protein B0H19DRAFT_1272592 [Mycena capillaripes]